ncbi:MAG: bifunctional ADP-dependent (S)-NAD(P)H-hydrate dehydratase/NAD(P)H-hydrate epimerase, partial [Ruaniaceae bacterium]|nr:bifunctional ADP-dependent (S)-NAD(P)H-hydrate dehydratase/NAD(P)H-hydrate epimerase [Ruaniaceae bacterium]
MIRGYSAEAIRAAEAPLLAAGVPLMRHAALALAFTAMSEIRARGQRVAGSVTLSLVGGGNNGGDALWAAAELAHRGVQAWAALCAPSVHEEGLAACRAAGVRIVRVVPEGTPESPAPRRESAELLADDAAR